MAIYKNKTTTSKDDDEGSGTIESGYQEMLFTAVRDDLVEQPLSQDDERLLIIHKSRQAGHVEQARRDSIERAQRNQQTATGGTPSFGTMRGQARQAGTVKTHPLLSKKSSCVDDKVSQRTDKEEVVRANPELQNKLTHQHRPRLTNQPSPTPTIPTLRR